MQGYNTFQYCFLAGGFLALILTPLVMRFSVRVGAVDRPAHRKVHKEPIPLMGGLAVFAGTWLPILPLLFYNNPITDNILLNGYKLLLLAFSCIYLVGLGILDDTVGLRPRHKLLGQGPLALLLVIAGFQFHSVYIPFIGPIDSPILLWSLSFLWIVGITNAVNLIDGLDGLAGGVAFLVALSDGIIAVTQGQMWLACLLFAFAGSCLGFLRYNFSPAKIFLGDTGSLFLGLMLALSALMLSSKRSTTSAFVVAFLVMGYPVLDTFLAMTRRAIRGKPIFSSDAGHIHHKLLARGMDHGLAVLTIYAICITFCLFAFFLISEQPVGILISFFTLSVAIWVALWRLGYIKQFTSPTLRKERELYRSANLLAKTTRARILLAEKGADLVNALRDIAEQYGLLGMEVTLPSSKSDRLDHDNILVFDFVSTKSDFQTPPISQNSLRTDTLFFENTGFRVVTFYDGSGHAIREQLSNGMKNADNKEDETINAIITDLQTEYRLLFSDVVRCTNQRFSAILRA